MAPDGIAYSTIEADSSTKGQLATHLRDLETGDDHSRDFGPDDRVDELAPCAHPTAADPPLEGDGSLRSTAMVAPDATGNAQGRAIGPLFTRADNTSSSRPTAKRAILNVRVLTGSGDRHRLGGRSTGIVPELIRWHLAARQAPAPVDQWQPARPCGRPAVLAPGVRSPRRDATNRRAGCA